MSEPRTPVAVARYNGGDPCPDHREDEWFIVWERDRREHLKAQRFYTVVEVVERREPGHAVTRQDIEDIATLCGWAEAARGHGIEECANPGQPDTEWDEIQRGLRDSAEVVRACLVGRTRRARVKLWRKTRGAVKQVRRELWATENFPAFRLGYIAALDDVERTGLRPITDETKREAADRALKRIVDCGERGQDGD